MAIGRGRPPDDPRPRVPPPGNPRPKAIVIHPRPIAAAPETERRPMALAPALPPSGAATATRPAAVVPAEPIRIVRAMAPRSHLPMMWGFGFKVAVIAVLAAIVLVILGIERSTVVEAASWVLLITGGVQLASVLATGGRRD